MIEGVMSFELNSVADERGSFTELYRGSGLPGQMRQANLSFSFAGVLRGMHFHRRQSDYWIVLGGRGFVSLYDLRSGSPTEGNVEIVEIDGDDPRIGLFLPPGVAHGFLALTDMRLLYLVSQEYDAGEDEFGFAWNDPELAVTWPVAEPMVSRRDADAPSLAEARRNPVRYRT
jgi:dTDP-4-dehydrorhamnose 3,5-epimerase